ELRLRGVGAADQPGRLLAHAGRRAHRGHAHLALNRVLGGRMSEPVATVQSLFRYPVKSMRGEALTEARLTFQGVAGDRRYAFVQAAARSVFPWLTGRELRDLLRYQPQIEMDGTKARVYVATPAGDRWPVESEELRGELEARSGRQLFFMQDHRGIYDIA